jgi:cell division protein ZipA
VASELRWILLALSVLLLIGIWWWGVRRSRRAPPNPMMGPTVMGPTAMGPTAMGPTVMGSTVIGKGPAIADPAPDHAHDDMQSREWGVPPFEPLNIHTADFDAVQLPVMSATGHLEDVTFTLNPLDPVDPVSPREPVFPAEAPAAAPAPVSAAAPAERETQRIVTVRVCALDDAQWPGADLLAALERHGLKFGRYNVFHARHSSGRTLFCAAGLVEPGTFDLARMPEEQFRGLTLFAVLPGPADALETIDALIATAVKLADTLHGAVQDARGAPLSAQRAEALREDVAHFQRSLSTS